MLRKDRNGWKQEGQLTGVDGGGVKLGGFTMQTRVYANDAVAVEKTVESKDTLATTSSARTQIIKMLLACLCLPAQSLSESNSRVINLPLRGQFVTASSSGASQSMSRIWFTSQSTKCVSVTASSGESFGTQNQANSNLREPASVPQTKWVSSYSEESQPSKELKAVDFSTWILAQFSPFSRRWRLNQ